MRRWRTVAISLPILVVAFLLPGRVMAQDFEALPPVVAAVLAKTGVIVDGLLGTWVAGNDLTDSAGRQLVASVGEIVVNFTHFFAMIVTLF